MIWPRELMPSWTARGSAWLEFVLATPVVLWCGRPFFQRFWTSLVNRSANMFTLIGLGIGVAYLYSVVATLAPQIFPDFLRKMGGYPDVYFEAAAAITALVLLGQVMELSARGRTSARDPRAARSQPQHGSTGRLLMAAERRYSARSSQTGRSSCACVPEKRFRLMAWFSMAPALSTNR